MTSERLCNGVRGLTASRIDAQSVRRSLGNHTLSACESKVERPVRAVWMTLAVAIGAAAMALGLAAPAGADTGDGQCPLAISILCRLVPIAPELDHDIDLTRDPAMIGGQHLPVIPGGNSGMENAPPAPICATGCV